MFLGHHHQLATGMSWGSFIVITWIALERRAAGCVFKARTDQEEVNSNYNVEFNGEEEEQGDPFLINPICIKAGTDLEN